MFPFATYEKRSKQNLLYQFFLFLSFSGTKLTKMLNSTLDTITRQTVGVIHHLSCVVKCQPTRLQTSGPGFYPKLNVGCMFNFHTKRSMHPSNLSLQHVTKPKNTKVIQSHLSGNKVLHISQSLFKIAQSAYVCALIGKKNMKILRLFLAG